MKQKIFPELPVLRYFYNENEHDRLSNFTIVAVQHILETTGSLFEALVTLGVKPSNVYLLGKSYSTSPEVAEKLKQIGINLIPNMKQKNIGEFKYWFKKDIQNLWQNVSNGLNNKPKNILILDEGGRCTLSIPENLRKQHKIISVEQTTSGYKRLKENCVLPVVNVARSAVKVGIEANLIAEKVLSSIEESVGIDKSKKYGIVGFGAIGEKIFKVFISSTSLQMSQVLFLHIGLTY